MRLGLSAAPGDSRLLRYTGNIPFYALSTALTDREDSGLLRCIGNISFHALSTVHGFGFVGVGGVSEQPVIIIQQFQPAPITEPREPTTNRVYVPPRWVDGGHRVEVLQPGYWTDAKQAAER